MPTNWSPIIEACKRQDPAAQEQIYRGCYAGMIKVCLRYARGQADTASAIYNQAMLKVIGNIRQYSGKGAFEGWVRSIVVNTCIDHCRSKSGFSPDELHEANADLFPVIPETYNRISSREIMALIHELPGNTALVFNLFAMEGYKHEEIGRILGISAGTSKWHLNEARKLLKQKLDHLIKKENLANAI
ncbi:MAG: RNA polymerase sigma factor [Chitinophagaceae bacterium]|nr:RNA polymerase sigma factor [Chitinophagaceae bacterium]